MIDTIQGTFHNIFQSTLSLLVEGQSLQYLNPLR